MQSSNKIKIPIVFFGTQEFAVTILEGLINSPILDIQLVITQPDRPVGRKQELQAPPVKNLAEKYNLPLVQPESLKNFQFPIDNIQLFIVAQYGMLIPKNILNLPSLGTINVHTSLLPKYRGASPIQSAIINGDKKTGITIMLMDVGMDTGPILSQREVEINSDDTYLSLEKKMADNSSQLLLLTLPQYLSGEIKPIQQDNTKATACKKLDRDDGHIDWTKTTEEIYNLYRGLFPWPGVWTLWNDKRIKILSMASSKVQSPSGVVQVEADNIYVGTRNGSVQILELQLEGKQKMNAKEFYNGYKNFSHSLLK